MLPIGEIEVYKVTVFKEGATKGDLFYKEAKRIFYDNKNMQGKATLEVSASREKCYVVVHYEAPIINNGGDLISMEVDGYETFSNLNDFKKFLEKTAA